MANLLVNERDVKFILYEQLNVEELCESERYSECSRELFDMILEAGWKFAENELWPINADGDAAAVRLENGVVMVPESFHRAYRLYCEGGWTGLALEAEHQGQGCPIVVYFAALESFMAANLAFMAYPGLTLGAARLIQHFGSPDQQETFMTKMFSGEWGGTMCLTEPQAGSDVGAVRTRAKRNADGTYYITGSKIFISGGDHDLCENVVHTVLARIEGAPTGVKGISIFIVPKRRIENGVLQDNDVTTVAVEKKMGLHGQATCALNFGERDDCVGYLVGEENAGIKIMFHLMNEARLVVGFHGLGPASAAYMHALRYACDRIQGPHVSNIREADAGKVAIIEHPDVRRMLMWMKSVTEGSRGLLYFVAYCQDRIGTAKDDEEAAHYQGLIDLLIPVCKSWSTDMGFRVTELAIQVYGGYGYCREYPVEQLMRDVKVSSIYEGTNGIQALDLVGRKLPYKQGALFRSFLGEVEKIAGPAGDNPRLKNIADLVQEAKSRLVEVTVFFAQKGMAGDIMIPVLYATPYQELFGDFTVGFILLWQAMIADEKLQTIYEAVHADTDEEKQTLLLNNVEAAFYFGKISSAKFFANTFLSLAPGKARAILSGERSALDMPREAFCQI